MFVSCCLHFYWAVCVYAVYKHLGLLCFALQVQSCSLVGSRDAENKHIQVSDIIIYSVGAHEVFTRCHVCKDYSRFYKPDTIITKEFVDMIHSINIMAKELSLDKV